ncbi:anthranilate synthase component I [Siculibacillus lacustris]|uniref:Anthranilate synthase component 1 n=1 Tax=Siculibacillus lacustris TaxID=1549641 RepID=A0A4Q9VN50_9HYPH|nr:anthranilate synthase component I [Siculibacillus lacustris]TBW37039.1 anthranilate synthase component I [Siculibacillus lacustris]
MRVEPSPEAFAPLYDAGRSTVVWTTLVADLETPVSAYLKVAAGRDPSILLESVEGGSTRGRYSMIALDPDLVFRARGEAGEINRRFAVDRTAFEPVEGRSLDVLRSLVHDNEFEMPPGLPPMSAGMFGYLGYDMVRQMEAIGAPNPDPIGLPDAILVRPRTVLIFDAVKDEIWIVTRVHPEAGVSAPHAHARAVDRLTAVVDALDRPLARGAYEIGDLSLDMAATSNTTPAQYAAMVDRAKDYIRAGDIFQVVLSQRFEAPFPLPPFALYRALRRVNPAPFLYFLDFGDFAVAGSSPEILVRVRDGEVTIRPIAGTRPRGATPVEDERNAADLLADPKECAEHLMLLDLGRNDVGRVASIGSVRVTDKFFVEYYSHVMHIVSNVVGRLAPGRDALDALAAGFPAGTVSGAPKVRAMEIIDELEAEKRGLYAGCVGYFSADGAMDTCIALRTAVVRDGRMYVQAGAGIVADSVPASEQVECVNKAKALFRAAEEAVRFAATVGDGQ